MDSSSILPHQPMVDQQQPELVVHELEDKNHFLHDDSIINTSSLISSPPILDQL